MSDDNSAARFAQLMANMPTAQMSTRVLSVLPDANTGAGHSSQGFANATFKPSRGKPPSKLLGDMGFSWKALGESFANCKLQWSEASIAEITGENRGSIHTNHVSNLQHSSNDGPGMPS